ncbi:unnamed protein product [Merluccius merluccius]
MGPDLLSWPHAMTAGLQVRFQIFQKLTCRWFYWGRPLVPGERRALDGSTAEGGGGAPDGLGPTPDAGGSVGSSRVGLGPEQLGPRRPHGGTRSRGVDPPGYKDRPCPKP